MASVLAMPEDLDDPIYDPENNSKSFEFSDYNLSPYKSCKSLSSAKIPPKSPRCMSSQGWFTLYQASISLGEMGKGTKMISCL